eukprot:145450_1
MIALLVLFLFGTIHAQPRSCAGSAGPSCFFGFNINIDGVGECSVGNDPSCFVILNCNYNNDGNVGSISMEIFDDPGCTDVRYSTQTITSSCQPFNSCTLANTQGSMTTAQMNTCCGVSASSSKSGNYTAAKVYHDFEEYITKNDDDKIIL